MGDSKTLDQTSSALLLVAAGAQAFPPIGTVVGLVAGAVAGLCKVCSSLFGSSYTTTGDVRWLLQKYQYFVLGDASVTSDNKVDQSQLTNCWNWFAAVSGVPIYNQVRYANLRGTNTGGVSLNLTLLERVSNYMQNPDVSMAGLTYDQVEKAAIIMATLDETHTYAGQNLGAWANQPTAAYWWDDPSVLIQSAAVQAVNQAAPSDILAPTTTTSSTSPLPASLSGIPAWFQGLSSSIQVGIAVFLVLLCMLLFPGKDNR